ncbi:MAG: transcriptional regulator [Achromobacter pestifer]
MNLHDYFDGDEALSAAALALRVCVSPALIYQWRTGRRPVPVKHCAPIEQATGGAVTRRDLRPADCNRIWPELAEGAKAQ